ncbi:1-acyl-sn-glycerol-3-phosphate acyltransferase [Jejuia pallidilutea]|nr:1-acyl-sn-glycerol-3-phosphate acyltransferase [Jejuia pallidilutea]
MQRYGQFPMGLGAHVKFTVHKPLKLATFTDKKALIEQVEHTIKAHIHP